MNELMGSLKKMKGVKVSGIYGIPVKTSENGGTGIIDRFLRIFNRYIKSGVVPETGRQRVSSRYTKGRVTEEVVQVIEGQVY